MTLRERWVNHSGLPRCLHLPPPSRSDQGEWVASLLLRLVNDGKRKKLFARICCEQNKKPQIIGEINNQWHQKIFTLKITD